MNTRNSENLHARQRTLIADPVGGLANRMRFIDSFCHLANETNSKLVIRWGIDGMNCEFNRLFDIASPIFQVIDTRNIRKESGFTKRKREFFDRISGFQTMQGRETAALAGDMRKWKEVVARGNLVMRADHRFIRPPVPYEWLKIQDNIQQRVEEIVKPWSRNILGVHIRRTDNQWSRDRSPTSGFTEKIDKAIEEDDQTEVFLASDSEDEVRYLEERYGQRVRKFVKTSLDRSSEVATEEALVDFLCLSRTNRIIGSFWSSFSAEAAELGRIPIEVVDTGEK